MKSLFFVLILFGAVFMAGGMSASVKGITVPVLMAAEGGMDRVRLELKKLRDAMASMKELNELEKAGMPKADVDRMRRAMMSKINDMMTDAMASIREL